MEKSNLEDYLLQQRKDLESEKRDGILEMEIRRGDED